MAGSLTLADSARLRYATGSIMYFAQGILQGLLAIAIPVWLASQGVGAGDIGSYLAVIVLPWAFKLLTGPLMDRYEFLPMGRRRPWVIGAQLGMSLALLAMILVEQPVEQRATRRERIPVEHDAVLDREQRNLHSLVENLPEVGEGLGLPRADPWMPGRVQRAGQQCPLQLQHGRVDAVRHSELRRALRGRSLRRTAAGDHRMRRGARLSGERSCRTSRIADASGPGNSRISPST